MVDFASTYVFAAECRQVHGSVFPRRPTPEKGLTQLDVTESADDRFRLHWDLDRSRSRERGLAMPGNDRPANTCLTGTAFSSEGSGLETAFFPDTERKRGFAAWVDDLFTE